MLKEIVTGGGGHIGERGSSPLLPELLPERIDFKSFGRTANVFTLKTGRESNLSLEFVFVYIAHF